MTIVLTIIPTIIMAWFSIVPGRSVSLFAVASVTTASTISSTKFPVTILRRKSHPLTFIFNHEAFIGPADGDFLTQQLFYRTQTVNKLFTGHGNCFPILTRSCSASDTVNVTLRFQRNIIVDYHLKIVDMQAPGSNICCHQKSMLSLFHLINNSQPL